jgi:hypothetical protein
MQLQEPQCLFINPWKICSFAAKELEVWKEIIAAGILNHHFGRTKFQRFLPLCLN